jgi:hypothetical protein
MAEHASNHLGRRICRVPAPYAASGFCLLISLIQGCADLSYQGITLGMRQAECARQLEGESVQRTELGFCAVRTDLTGRTDALVVLVSREGVVTGKLQATFWPANPQWGRRAAYRLRGQLDPTSSALGATGPVDSLRAILDDLASYRGPRPAMQAHAWVAAGLVRMIERWPHVGELASAYPHLADVLEQVPGGGESSLRADRQGVFWFEYQQGPLP